MKCRVCGVEFNKSNYQQVYCTLKCRELFYSNKQKQKVLKNSLLNKKVKCKECNNLFIRKHSKNVTCSPECKNSRKIKQKQAQNENFKKGEKYLSARINNINNCTICHSAFRAKNKRQKCCSNKCRIEYNKIDKKNRTKSARNNINIRIAENLRSRISRAIRKNQKGGSAVKDLGCSIKDLKNHLESQFQDGMSWDNYGEWHIDHIKPLASFDLTDEEQFKEAANYKNLQPLWAKDNIKKGAK